MIRKILIPAALAVALLGGTAAVASAAETGPDTVACAQATDRVTAAARAANRAADALNRAQEQIDAALQVQVDAAEAKLTAALALRPRDLPANLQAVAAAEAQYQAVLKLVEDKATPSTLRTALADAKAALQTALDAKVRACTAPKPDPTPAPTTAPKPAPAPTTTVAPTPSTTIVVTPAPDAPASSDRVVVEVPQGAVDTGWA